MSIVERAVDLLRPVAEPYGKAGASEETAATRHPLPERAVSSAAQLSGQRDEHELARQSLSSDTLVSCSRSRTVNVNLDKLRRQHLMTPDGGRTAITESFRRIKRHILANVANPGAGARRNLIMITSALPREGKTFCSINLAMSLATEIERTVMLVDADVANPALTSALGISAEAERGLMDLLVDSSATLDDVLCKTTIGKLSILPAGSRNDHATEVLASEAMRALLEETVQRFPDRLIIFDSPPLLAASEACVLASHMGQIVLVVEAGRTSETALKDALSRIESCNVVGAVLNKGSAPGDGFGGYGYGYGYGYGP